MAKHSLPIATPKKGKAMDHVAEQAQPYGRFMDAPANQSVSRESQPLVNSVTEVWSGRREDMLENIKKGLKFNSIIHLEAAFCASQKEIASVLSIPTSTLMRRKKAGRLHMDESDRVVRLARLKDAALTLMHGDDEAAVTWLRTPLEVLGGETPLEHASTELGARDVEDLMGRLRHGIFS